MAQNQGDMTEIIFDAIKKGIQKMAEERWNELRTKMVADFDADRDQIIAGIVLNISKHMSVERMSPDIRITIAELPK